MGERTQSDSQMCVYPILSFYMNKNKIYVICHLQICNLYTVSLKECNSLLLHFALKKLQMRAF